MKIISKAMGAYQTNCYIVEKKGFELIIDPGVEAVSWVKSHVSNPKAILNTHGHFDHIWSNAELSRELNIPIYCPKDDAFMLENDIFSHGTPCSKADVEVEHDEEFSIEDCQIRFWHFPGHTPGCSAIQIEDALFSGDFLFKRSIGRVDFPYSDAEAMKKSLEKIMSFKQDFTLYPGHGESSSLFEEQKNIPLWLRYLS